MAAAAVSPRLALAQPQPFTLADKQAMLDLQNDARCGVSPAAAAMPPLVWDSRLEATALAWAQGCQDVVAPIGLLDHNPNRSNGHPWNVGENISAQSSGAITPATGVGLWVGEGPSYDFASNSCSAITCGHYTQVVWAGTRRVGCARYNCAGLAYPSTIVCDYGPAGNNGNRPYTAGSAVNGACDLIFADGFELGNLVPWSSSQTGGGDLNISTAAGLTQTLNGLQAVVNDTTGLYVQDDTPLDLDRYRARFRFDPNTFNPGESQNHLRTRLFILFEDGPRRLAAVVLRRVAGQFALMARARLDDNSQVSTPFTNITDAPHVVEIDWKRSSTPAADDGWLKLWIDGAAAEGAPTANLPNLDNNLSSLDFVRLGALSVKTGAAGTLFFDEFESRSASYIGP
jgi:hypothetical protein